MSKIINRQTIKTVAKIYKIRLTSGEIDLTRWRLQGLLNQLKILGKLKSQTKNIRPLDHVCGLKNIFREDRVTMSLKQSEVLSGTDSNQDGFIKTLLVFEEK